MTDQSVASQGLLVGILNMPHSAFPQWRSATVVQDSMTLSVVVICYCKIFLMICFIIFYCYYYLWIFLYLVYMFMNVWVDKYTCMCVWKPYISISLQLFYNAGVSLNLDLPIQSILDEREMPGLSLPTPTVRFQVCLISCGFFRWVQDIWNQIFILA